MRKIYLLLFLFVALNCKNIFSQSEVNESDYNFKLSLNPQDGYSLVIVGNGSLKDSANLGNFELGISRTFISSEGHETSVIDRTFILGVFNYKSELFYSLGIGYNLRSFFDLGLFLNFANNYKGSNAFILRPHIGFVCLPPMGSGYAEFGYNINFLKNDFDVPNSFVVGIRYNLGFLKSRSN